WTSGPALAAKAIEKADPHTSVTFVSVACSGATIANLLGEYNGREFGPADRPLPAQIEQVRRLLCPSANSRDCLGPFPHAELRHIDALLINVGGNDVGFGDMIEECGAPGNSCHKEAKVQNMVRDGLASLPDSYRKLDEKLRSTLSYSE